MSKEKNSIEIKLHDENKHDLYPLLTHLYRKGFDKIILHNLDSKSLKEVKRVVNYLMLGFDITERKNNSCTIENLSEPKDQKFDSLINRIFFIVNEGLSIITEDLEKGSFGNMDDMEDMRSNSDRYTFFCKRNIIKGVFVKNPVIAWEFLTFLFHIQHTSYYLYRYLSENKIKKSKKILDALKDLKKYFEFFEKAYNEKDVVFVHKINKLKHKYQFGELLTTIEKAKTKEAVIFAYIREIYRLIQIGSSSILSNIFEKEYKLE